jgi:hypothetical protein
MPTNPVKKHLTYTIRDFYKDYRKSCSSQKKFPKRNYIKYRDFIYDVFTEIFHEIITNGWHFVLPYSLGEFYLSEDKRNTGKRVFLKDQSIKNGKATYTFNNHTLRKVFKFKWDKTYARFPTAKYYKFELIDGEEKLHKEYNVGRRFIRNYLFDMGKNPNIKIPTPINRPKRKLEKPNELNR